jgi:CSLREA domain-containing protein
VALNNRRLIGPLLLALVAAQFGLGLHQVSAATIVVTTTNQEVNDDGACSLEEAIFSANYDDNIAIDPANPNNFIVTGCNKGNGDDTIVLPQGGVFQLNGPVVDQFNSLGPTATPLIFSNITIEANGSQLVGKANGSSVVGTPNQNFRAFAVGSATVDLSEIDPGRTVSGTGELTINNAYIRNFQSRGGDGASGGGGGLGAGGAIYLKDGELTLVNSTFQGNFAFGGNGSTGGSGAGGGLSGNGGKPAAGNAGGGGGSEGNGGNGSSGLNIGGGGGGTLTNGGSPDAGFRCGASGGDTTTTQGDNGKDASCSGGGGGGGTTASNVSCVPPACNSPGHGGNGSFGGGGGGGGNGESFGDDGGNGGFGGGGGASGGPGYFGTTNGGNGGFGGGGGSSGTNADDTPGTGGTFAGNATKVNGGGGAGLGGAIFNDSGIVSTYNSTFVSNSAYGGAGGDTPSSVTAGNGDGQGNAIFSRNGTTNLTHITVSDSSDPNGTGIVDVAIVGDNATAHLNLANSILANNKAGSPNGQLFFFNGGAVAQSNSGNLIQNAGANTSGTGAVNGVAQTSNPNLSALTLNPPGETPTMAIATTSSAYQTAASGKCQPTDQRGVPRKSGCDIGAYENNDFTQPGPTLVVNTTSDHTPDVCSAVDCTLREAILRANQLSGANTITFANNVIGTITLGSTLGPLSVTDSTTIVGPGARVLSISGSAMGQVFRVFNFTGGTSTVSGLTIRGGFQSPGSATSAGGAGVFNALNTVLTFNDCAFLLNSAHAGDAITASADGATAQGGAILNGGVLTLNRCTLSNNGAQGGRGANSSGAVDANVHGGKGGDAQGGALFNGTGATLTINNSTFSGNSATAGNGGDGQFGGNGGSATGAIINMGTMTITAATLSGNTGSGGAGGAGSSKFSGGSSGTGNGGLSAVSGTSTVRNTISANNSGNHGGGVDVNGTFTSGGYNLIGIGDSGTGFSAMGDQVGTAAAPIDAKLGLLQNNGGPTNTFALLADSPALDQGKAFGVELGVDQRGGSFARTIDAPTIPNANGGDGTDIGAFESTGPFPSPTPTPTPAASPTPIPIPTATPTPIPNPTTLANISTRLRVETGDNVLIGGFIVTGTQSKKIMIRAIGPSLPFADDLSDPILELHDSSGALLDSNDNWVDSPDKQAIIDTTIAPTNDLESAIVATLPANSSGYTAIVRGVNNGTGIGVVEAYDLDRTVDSKLANISTRGLVQTGDDVLIAGTIVVGATPQYVIVEALGPSLSVPGNLADPILELRDVNGALIDMNDNWVDSPNKQAIIDSTIPPTNDLESAIIATLPAGGAQYTAIVRGVNDTTGVAVVEVFALN